MLEFSWLVIISYFFEDILKLVFTSYLIIENLTEYY